MDSSAISTNSGLLPVLILLASSVIAVAVCRSARLPPMIGYLLTGLALGPHALGVVSEREETHRLAEFGVVFLMFSIGLEFSLPRLVAMRRLVFGLGLAQVGVTIAIAVAVALALGASWQAGLALGGIAAMSSTAIVSKLLAERGELDRIAEGACRCRAPRRSRSPPAGRRHAAARRESPPPAPDRSAPSGPGCGRPG